MIIPVKVWKYDGKPVGTIWSRVINHIFQYFPAIIPYDIIDAMQPGPR